MWCSWSGTGPHPASRPGYNDVLPLSELLLNRNQLGECLVASLGEETTDCDCMLHVACALCCTWTYSYDVGISSQGTARKGLSGSACRDPIHVQNIQFKSACLVHAKGVLVLAICCVPVPCSMHPVVQRSASSHPVCCPTSPLHRDWMASSRRPAAMGACPSDLGARYGAKPKGAFRHPQPAVAQAH